MDLPDKSNPAKKKQITAVVSGAEEMKRPATKRFMDSILQESPKNVARRVGTEVVVPRFKSSMEEAFNNFLAGMLWGGGGNRPSSVVRGSVVRGGVAYSQQSTQSALSMARQASPVESSGGYRDLVVPTLQDAELLLAGMYDLLNEYRVVAVGDLYELANKSPSISDNAIGWRSLDGARISAVRDGYVLELPRPTTI